MASLGVTAASGDSLTSLIAQRRALEGQVQKLRDSRGVTLEHLDLARGRISDLRRQIGQNSVTLEELGRQQVTLAAAIKVESERISANRASLAALARRQYQASPQTDALQIIFDTQSVDQLVDRVVAVESMSNRAHNIGLELRRDQRALTDQSNAVRQKQAEAQGLQSRLEADRAQLAAAAADYQARIDGLDASASELLARVEQLNREIAAAIRPPSGGSVARDQVIAIIRAAASRYGVNGDQLVRVADCESHLNPRAYNPSSNTVGLFQFQPGTFYAHGGQNIWDAADQSNVAAKMFSQGYADAWSCR
jgi:peptidoglycan hydrolase CwlO-like protein